MSHEALLQTKAIPPACPGANPYTSMLMRGMTHKMNNLLTIFHGYSTLIGSGGGLPEHVSDGLREIQKAAETTSTLLDHVLNAAREPSYHEEPTQLAGVLEATVKTTRSGNDQSGCRVECPPGLEAMVDPGRLRQVLVPLLVNAIEASPPGGEILLWAREETDDSVTVHVIDRGPGIAAEHADRIFEPFFTTKRALGCLGLGLPLARRLADGMGWKIGVASLPEVGTRVEIRVPAVRISSNES